MVNYKHGEIFILDKGTQRVFFCIICLTNLKERYDNFKLQKITTVNNDISNRSMRIYYDKKLN